MIIGFDMDGVITKENGGWTQDYYASCRPNLDTITLMRKLSRKGYKIIIYTSRLSNEVKVVTIQWLQKHGVPFDAIHFDKPLYDFFVDDRSISVERLERQLLDCNDSDNGKN